MPPREWTFRIQDILDAIEKIQRFTSVATLETFERDEKLIDAVVHNLTVIGEAANHIPSEVVSKETGIPWRQMVCAATRFTPTGTCGRPSSGTRFRPTCRRSSSRSDDSSRSRNASHGRIRMTREVQKRQEVRLVEKMRRALSGLPEGAIQPADEPDVCITSAGRRTGIEVTELHQRPAPGQAPRRLLESERAGVVRRAQTLAEVSAVPVVDVAVHFNDAPIGKRDRDRIARALVDLVSAHIPRSEGSETIDLWREAGSSLPGIRTVRIFRARILTRHHWAVPDSGWVQMDFIPELQAAIDAKNTRYGRYRERCDECWLLIVASGGRPSGLFELSDATRNHVYQSLFARTFFMDAFDGTLTQLQTRSARVRGSL